MRVTSRRFILKCAAGVAALLGLLATAQLSDRRSVTTWAPNAKLEAAPSAAPQTAKQRLTAGDAGCAPQIPQNLIRGCPAKSTGGGKVTDPVTTPLPQLHPTAFTPTPVEPAPADASMVTDVGTTGNLPALPAATPSSVEPSSEAAPIRPTRLASKRPRQSSPRVVAERPPLLRTDRPREPVQFRLAEGRN